MIPIETNRLIIKSNITVANKQLLYPSRQSAETSILNLEPMKIEDTGFGIYLREDLETLIGWFSFESKYGKNELTYGVVDRYRGKGYMPEALCAFFQWYFSITKIKRVYALIGDNNLSSIKAAQKVGFQLSPEEAPYSCNWYALTRHRR